MISLLLLRLPVVVFVFSSSPFLLFEDLRRLRWQFAQTLFFLQNRLGHLAASRRGTAILEALDGSADDRSLSWSWSLGLWAVKSSTGHASALLVVKGLGGGSDALGDILSWRGERLSLTQLAALAACHSASGLSLNWRWLIKSALWLERATLWLVQCALRLVCAACLALVNTAGLSLSYSALANSALA